MTNGTSQNAYNDWNFKQSKVYSGLSQIVNAVARADPDPYSGAFFTFASVSIQLFSLFSPNPEDILRDSINQLAKKLKDYFCALRAENAATLLLGRTTTLNEISRGRIRCTRGCAEGE